MGTEIFVESETVVTLLLINDNVSNSVDVIIFSRFRIRIKD